MKIITYDISYTSYIIFAVMHILMNLMSWSHDNSVPCMCTRNWGEMISKLCACE